MLLRAVAGEAWHRWPWLRPVARRDTAERGGVVIGVAAAWRSRFAVALYATRWPDDTHA